VKYSAVALNFVEVCIEYFPDNIPDYDKKRQENNFEKEYGYR
jgi:hypothetical protein